jgi:hypothetical protein
MQITASFFGGASIIHIEKYVLSVHAGQLVSDHVRDIDFNTLNRLMIKNPRSQLLLTVLLVGNQP